MQALLDFLVIETYTQFAALVAVLVGMATSILFLRRRRRLSRATAVKLIGAQRPAVTTAKSAAPAQSKRTSTSMNFDKLADMIAVATDRAGHISETQTAAALKLDTAEMAVNRLIADIDPVINARPAPKSAPQVEAPHRIAAA